MAQSDRRHRTQAKEAFDFSDEEVDAIWGEIVTETRRPGLDRATSAWNTIGEKYQGLGYRTST